MANECLVTKLKGTVDNNNLPVYGKAFISYQSSNESVDDDGLRIVIMVDKSFNVKFKSPVTQYQGPTQTDFNLVANIPYYFSVSKATVEANAENFIEISNLYNIKILNMYLQDYIQKPKVAASTPKSNIKSILKYNNPISITINKADMEDIPASAEYVQICNFDNERNLDITNILNNPNIDVLGVYDDQYAPSVVTLTRDMSNSPIRCLYAQINGDLLYLPNNLKLMAAYGNVINPTRSIEDIVNKMRTAGRTTGAMTIAGAKYSNILYNGQTLRSQFGTESVPAGNDLWGFTYLTWTSNSITFVSTAPEEINSWQTIPTAISWYTNLRQ